MAISEKKYEQLFSEAQADAIRLRKERDAALNRARNFENDANQEHTEKLLLRNECIRLREAHGVMAGFIESLPDEIPPEVNAAENAVFPTERPKASGCPYTDSETRKELLAAEIRIDELGDVVTDREARIVQLEGFLRDRNKVCEGLAEDLTRALIARGEHSILLERLQATEAERDRLRASLTEVAAVVELGGPNVLRDVNRIARSTLGWGSAALAPDEVTERKDGAK
jgi:hypothetical protein